MLDEINQRLKAAKLGIRVVQRGDRLSLRATLPPRPDIGKTKPLFLRVASGNESDERGLYSNFSGVQTAVRARGFDGR
jgi:hypothetical protein